MLTFTTKPSAPPPKGSLHCVHDGQVGGVGASDVGVPRVESDSVRPVAATLHVRGVRQVAGVQLDEERIP